MKWEYKIVKTRSQPEVELNKLGEQGWELVGFSRSVEELPANTQGIARAEYVFVLKKGTLA